MESNILKLADFLHTPFVFESQFLQVNLGIPPIRDLLAVFISLALLSLLVLFIFLF